MEHYYTLEVWLPVFLSCLLSSAIYYFTLKLIPRAGPSFIKAHLYGIDLNKKDPKKIPEAIGVLIGCMFLISMFLFIPLLFGPVLLQSSKFPYDELVKMVAALLSICCMLLLGFADDVLDLRWKYKLILPTVASLPLLMVYYVTFNSTTIIVPKPFRFWIGQSVDLGFLYYIYMGMLAVFCTNAINILAGVNGLEAGQSFIIAGSIAVFNLCELSGNLWRAHQFSLCFIIPFMATTLALLKYNWFPSKVFVGDTFCYFAGMTFAVVGILGHFSKTVLLFFIPQVINFLYSTPQLFHIIPCPRHRLPRLDHSGLLDASRVEFSSEEIGRLGHILLQICDKFKLVNVTYKDKIIITNNFTIINFILIKMGPMHEEHLTTVLLTIQIFCSGIAFLIRYPLASLFYDVS